MELVVEKQAFLWYSFVNTVLNGHFWKLNGFRDWKCPHKIILLYANDLNPVQSCLLWNPLLCRDWIEPIYSEFKVSFQFASSSELALIEPLACFSHPKGTRPKWITQVVVLSFILEYFAFHWEEETEAGSEMHWRSCTAGSQPFPSQNLPMGRSMGTLHRDTGISHSFAGGSTCSLEK